MLRCAVFLLFVVLTQAQQGVLRLMVDATDAPRRLIHVQLNVPTTAGPLTLVYPKWIPGEHGPTGPIADVVSLKFQAHGPAISEVTSQSLDWRRDPTDLYAFNVTVPGGATSLTASFDFISPPASGGFSAGSSMTTELAVINWNQFLLYPRGSASDDVRVQANLRLPRGWRYGTALAVAKQSGENLEFHPVSLTALVDSPVSAGAHYRTVDLGDAGGARHFMHIAGDTERAIAVTQEWTDRYKKLAAEASVLFGVRHYREYHFLLTLSDHVAHFGLEHHESSDNRLEENALLDVSTHQLSADLMAHEFVHSWNGKYRRPAGLALKNYQEPANSELVWIYEGLTEYLGEVLAARSGLVDAPRFQEWLADIGARLDHQTGRAWRSLADTSISAPILFNAREDYATLRRGIDFYSEGALVWLEVDTRIRKLSGGAKSLDSFCRAFFGGPGGAPAVSAYSMGDVVAALNSVQPFDWAAFFAQRVETVRNRAPSAGIEDGGWRVVYRDQRSAFWTAEETQNKVADLSLSIGAVVNNEGWVNDLFIGSAAHRAGLAPGAKITSVNGQGFSLSTLREAVRSTQGTSGPIEIAAQNGGQSATYRIDYRDGERYPHLERDNGRPDVLSAIIQARTR